MLKLKFSSVVIVYNPISQTVLDQYRFLGNCPPTPPLTHHFALGEK